MTRGKGIDSGNDRHKAWQVSVVAETGSTNDDMVRAAERGELADRTVLRADHQTSGRGRLDRRWDAPPGSNLLASVYLARPGDRPVVAVQRFGVAIVVALLEMLAQRKPEHADHDAVHRATVPTIGLKWPNDVLVDGRKVAGILAQRSTAAEGLVVGFGVNVGWAPPTSALVSDIVDCSPSELLAAVLRTFDTLPADHGAFTALYRRHLVTIGQRVSVHLPGDVTFVGLAVDIDTDGRLVVRPDVGGDRTFDVGDVVHLRPDAS